MYFFLKKALLQYNSCIMQFIHLKCRVQWFLVYLQLCATITIMVNFTFFYHGQVLLKPSDYLVGLKGLGWRDHKTPSGSFRSLGVRVDGVVIMYQEKCKHKRQKEIEIFFSCRTYSQVCWKHCIATDPTWKPFLGSQTVITQVKAHTVLLLLTHSKYFIPTLASFGVKLVAVLKTETRIVFEPHELSLQMRGQAKKNEDKLSETILQEELYQL